MIIDKSNFDFNGAVCDKIGVGYHAFRAQPLACSMAENTYVDLSHLSIRHYLISSPLKR